ncbi:MAG: hypothetical protein O7D86_10415 [Proteobacteria bacterium]|nr:hypothetical protein [Pseudomonadota bacterium]
MKDKSSDISKTPVLLIDPASVQAFHIFNPNDWSGLSKAIVSSCAAQHGLINYSVNKLHELFGNAEQICSPKITELKNQWKTSNWPIDNCNYLAEVPEVHLFMQVYLSSIKTFLDLIVQLISTENIVYKKIHGFHKKRKDPGGELLHTLKNKTNNKQIADSLLELIVIQKEKWIDDAVNARDSLAHPEKGLIQVMFQLEIKPNKSEIELTGIIKPSIGTTDFNQWADDTFKKLNAFSELFISIIVHNKTNSADAKSRAAD